MPFESNSLRALGACRGFALWHYATADPLELLLRPGYFDTGGGLLRTGHQIHVTAALRTGNTGAWIEAEDNALFAVRKACKGNVEVQAILAASKADRHCARCNEPRPIFAENNRP